MNKNKNAQNNDFSAELFEDAGLDSAEALDIVTDDGICIIHKGQMTVLELATVIDTLSNLASDLTAELAKACESCDNCGDGNSLCEDCGTACSDVCAFLHGCKDTPAEWVRNCDLCKDLLAEESIRIPEYVLADAGIPTDAKLEAYADENGVITVTECDCQYGLGDLPPLLLNILAQSGICLASLDELIVQEEIVYGN